MGWELIPSNLFPQKKSIDTVKCQHCGYIIVKPYPKDQLCPKCGRFLEDLFEYVEDVQSGKIPTEDQLQKIEKRDVVKYMIDLETKVKPKIVHVEDPMAIGPEIIEKTGNSKKQKKKKKKSGVKIILCPICSNVTTNMKQTCPSCGYRLF